MTKTMIHAGRKMRKEVAVPRAISEIAAEISKDWPKPYFGAVPYLDAMHSLKDKQSVYGLDSAEEVVLYFLSNANTWRGEVARRCKAELNAIIK